MRVDGSYYDSEYNNSVTQARTTTLSQIRARLKEEDANKFEISQAASGVWSVKIVASTTELTAADKTTLQQEAIKALKGVLNDPVIKVSEDGLTIAATDSTTASDTTESTSAIADTSDAMLNAVSQLTVSDDELGIPPPLPEKSKLTQLLEWLKNFFDAYFSNKDTTQVAETTGTEDETEIYNSELPPPPPIELAETDTTGSSIISNSTSTGEDA
jgi:hypothetical protein